LCGAFEREESYYIQVRGGGRGEDLLNGTTKVLVLDETQVGCF